jgi:tetratricopeptide (TPR) repeat protein
LQSGGATAARQALCGLGGVGKTNLALEYANRHVGDYSLTLWCAAGSSEALADGLSALAPKLGLSSKLDPAEMVADVRRWLANNSGWLLILDGADAPEVLLPLCVRELPGSVLITSRAQNLGALGVASPIVLEPLPVADAVAFLKKRTGRSTLPLDEERAARALAERLGRLPFALEFMAAYLYATGTTFQQYETLYYTRRTEVLRRAPDGRSVAALAETWRRNVLSVESEFPAAGDVLRFSAFLAPDPVPLELIEEGALEISPTVERAAAEALTVNEVITPLLHFSLVSIAAAERTYSIHRLLQDSIRDALDQTARRQWAEKAVCALNAAFPDPEFHAWAECVRLLPHALAAGELIELFGFESSEAARLLNQTGYFLAETGRAAEAEAPYRRALAIRERTLGAEHPDTANSLNNLGFLCVALGRHAEAEPLYRRALAVRERTLGEEHSETTNTVNNLAELLHALGNVAEAEPLCRRALAVRERTLGAEHPITAQSLNNLASLEDALGNFLEAESLHRRALVIRERALGAEHPDTANSLNNLASFYAAHGGALEAEPLYRRAIAVRERALGAEHPLTAMTLNNLATLYAEQGKRAEAAALYRRALDIAHKTVGAQHPHARAFAMNLTTLLKTKRRTG